MGWEKRGNNNYYYRKKRFGEKVSSKYVGKGLLAEEFFRSDLMDRKLRQKFKDEIRQGRNELNALSFKMGKTNNLIKQILYGALLVAGFHMHKGQWRKKRNGQ